VAASASTGLAQAPGTRPPDLFVTRLQTVRPTSGASTDAAKTGPDGGPPLFLTKIDDRQAAADLDGPRRISMSVSRPMPLPDLLLLLVNGTPLSLVTDKDVSGMFIGDLKDLTMRQALEAVLFPFGLDYDLQGTLIRVFPRKASTRLFSLNFVNVRRTLQREDTNRTPVGGVQRGPELSSSTSSDPFGEIEQGVQSLLSASGKMHVDRTAGLVQVTDFAERLDQVGVYVEAVQLRAARQVRIDAHVFNVELGSTGTGAIDWNAAAIKNAAAARPADGYGPAGFAVTSIDAFARALAEQGTVTKVTAPAVVAMNNEPATIRVGKQLVYFSPTGSSESDHKRVLGPSTVLDGFTLSVLAQISADHFIQLHVSPSFAAPAGESKGPNGSAAPVMAVNETDTIMRVRDGETIVLAGFLSDVDRMTPASGFAKLFSGPSRTTVRSELVILLTPTIVGARSASPN
jgi:type II secretory pathway component HofQ